METKTKETITTQFERLAKIKGMIDSCKARLQINKDFQELMCGKSEDGDVLYSTLGAKHHRKYLRIANRLKRSYNLQIERMDKYKI